MKQKTKILAMHAELSTLFPNMPDHWELVDTSGGVEQAIARDGDEVEILLSASIEKLDKSVLDRFPNLKLIASVSAGFSNIDLNECKARNISVTNAPGMNSGDVADIAVTMMISLLLNMHQKHDYIMSDSWVNKAPPLRHSLRDVAVGIAGLGSIGLKVVKRLAPLGVDLKWWGPRPKPEISLPYVESLEALAEQCRGLIVCCRPDESNHNLISQKVMESLGANGALVNVSRGSLVDEPALIAALKNGKLGGAGLDVFDSEPTDSSNWTDVPNIILSPHQGGATYETLFAQAQLAQNNIENFLNGKPLLSRVV